MTLGTGLSSAGGFSTKLGSGALILTGNNTFTGLTTVSAGTLQLGNGISGYDGSIAEPNITIASGATSAFDLYGNQTYGGSINSTSTGNLTKLGSGTLALTGRNSSYGTTTVNGGTLNIGNGTTVGLILNSVGLCLAVAR